MRQKHIKAATPERMKQAGVLLELEKIDPKGMHTSLEIGSGKGQFITALAKDHPEALFIAVEININVCFRIMEKKEALKLDNLIIILGDANHITGYFEDHVIDTIYLNFSDPWPKPKHHKRRLTHPSFLTFYEKILKPTGTIQFRTDHDDLFYDSIAYFKSKFDVYDIDMQLKPSLYMTEYEANKRSYGHIYQLKARITHDQSNL